MSYILLSVAYMLTTLSETRLSSCKLMKLQVQENEVVRYLKLFQCASASMPMIQSGHTIEGVSTSSATALLYLYT
jgi:hypothetical protein